MAHVRRILATLRTLFRTHGVLDVARGKWYPPMAGAEGDPPAATVDPPEKTDDPPADDDSKDDDPPEKVTPDDDWQTKARKHEREAKKLRKEKERLEREAKEREDANKSEQEKALEKAREEARTEALAEAEKERRGDRLEVSVTRLSTRGFTVGEGDDEKTLRFADPDDAIVHVERAIAKGDIDADDIFDSEGKVNSDTLTEELGKLLDRKPHLAAGEAERPRPKGDPGSRKGEPAKSDLESMTPEDHAARKYGDKK